jgi:hypothetical protein
MGNTIDKIKKKINSKRKPNIEKRLKEFSSKDAAKFNRRYSLKKGPYVQSDEEKEEREKLKLKRKSQNHSSTKSPSTDNQIDFAYGRIKRRRSRRYKRRPKISKRRARRSIKN